MPSGGATQGVLPSAKLASLRRFGWLASGRVRPREHEYNGPTRVICDVFLGDRALDHALAESDRATCEAAAARGGFIR